ncbi:hypothetical protein A2866_02525 [Candidatus Roizmanbacteria bacterium RIFCSPHIGHO2_01_FULL_39_8]|uniref:Activator of Hsp90 ATPase homologue 1/2-like C-terminal domain-containing protein n=1 Tax=Candidatus Roizmanbacteria bacterium RIFCSPHIGHO2_01_FULL_39_8 TaxID=1802033 RepID=A0A1F7GJ18_9BACT|nr:MAG: hypothetical protein A2866_02525 [Candidatus Roizmanbacteria bacterium RIFCSPHIGHO2_01_FULL_39_8]
MPDPNSKELTIVRVFDAPVEVVWKYWSEPEYVKKWWGPKGFTCPAAHIDFRVGGKSHVAMHGPKGTEFDKDLWSIGVYKEIIPLKKIVTTDSFADERGNVVPATYYGMGKDFPIEMTIIVEFEDMGEKTKITLRHLGMPAGKDQEGANAGWNQQFDKLNELLQS